MSDDFSRSVDRAMEAIDRQLMRNMQKACDVILNESTENLQSLKHQSGALRASKFSEVKKEGNEIVGYVGYSSEYAPYVHEGTGIFAKNGDGRKEPWVYQDDRTGNFYTTSGQKPKEFLSKAMESKRQDVNKILGQ